MMPTLLRKLLSKRDDDGAAARPGENARPWASSEFDLAQIRLLVYQDCERRGRQVLFDSKAVCRPDGPELASEEKKTLRGRASEREKPPTYQYTRAASDVNMLAEMMFGAVSMSYRGSTLKVHHIRSPPQLMVSKVFSTGSRGSTTLQESLESVSQTFSSCIIHSDPVEMPRRGGSEDGDSGFTRSASLSSLLTTPLATPISSPSSSLSSSYHRRLMRSQTTSLQHGPLHRWSAEEMFSVSEESCSSAPAPVHRRKIAISIIITLPEKSHEQQAFQEFFFSHFALIESHMNRLKTAIEQAMAGCRRVEEHDQRVQQYLCAVMEALSEFRMTVWNMYMAPRISEPVWLTMNSQNAERSRLCQRFLQELRLLMEHGAKSRFLSTLLTAVLTHHLAWVSTVTPCSHPPITELPTKPASFSVGRLSKSHPYNPLWAQLVDLYGALGSPLRMCRTVVVGRRRELVQRVLYVLSYFIRCSELLERQHSPTDGPAHPCSVPLTDQSAPDHLTAADRSSEQLSANQSTGPSRVLFHIGSPGEAERGRRAGGPEGPGCGRKGTLMDIRRAESSDSALGDEEEACRSEVELPLPSCAEESGTGVHHFGRSLLAGFCPQYLPDFVLHGAASDERLERCLRGDLEHAVLHPALDERVCDALCIVADVERVCVRVVSSQRGGTEGGASGQDVLTSNLVHSLLTSILQLHALNVTAEFCVMHLEDRLQEVYLKSGSLAEYLRGRTRVCVQDLALALGVESSDVPLLAAVAGTHSPHVTRVLL